MIKSPGGITQSPVEAFEVQVRLFRNGQELGPPGDIGILAKMEQLTLGYGASGHRATFSMWDPSTIDHTVAPASVVSAMPIPRHGDEVLIQAKDSKQITILTAFGQPDSILFRGMIEDVASQHTPTGKRFILSCVSMAHRLDEYHITMSFNLLNDPFRPSPVFNPETGSILARTNLRTVAEIIKEILAFSDAWQTIEMFSYADIDWGTNETGQSMETDPRCGGYVPRGVYFVNRPKGLAIQEVLERAGNYRIYYDPTTGQYGRLRIVEINLACNRCGPVWDINFPAAVSTNGQGEDYVNHMDVISDATTWSSKSSANVVRIVSGPIRLYTGQYIIPEMIENTHKADPDNPTVVKNADDADRFKAVETDTVANQKARAVNADTTFYRFQHPVDRIFTDPRKFQQYPVGLPLFPDWNVHEDALPEFITIVGAQPHEGGTMPSGVTPAQYKWEAEYVQYTQGQASAMNISRLGRADSLRVYQAWYVKDKCPACQGSGNVKKVYTSSDNTPTITWVDTGPALSQTGAVGGTAKRIKRPTVSNYKMPPSKFGDSTFDVATANFEPWESTTDQPYPIPWKNMCPYCRGVGWKPEYKIRNIEPVLVEGRSTPVAATGTVSEVSVDPEFTQTTPETWEQSQNRIQVQMGPYVQLESSITTSHRVPLDKNYKNYSWQLLATTAGAKAPFMFPHPLVGYRYRLTVIANIGNTDPQGKVVPDDWKVSLPFTTILFGDRILQRPMVDNALGRVIMSSPAFICAEMNWSFPAYNDLSGEKKSILQANGLLRMQQPMGRLQPRTNAPIGFWRPARAWMQCFYRKDKFYYRPGDGDPNAEPVEFQYTNADGIESTFLAKAMIMDGRWCCEITKKNPDTWGETPNEVLSDRVIQAIVEDDEARIDTTEDDLKTMFIPPSADITPQEFEDIKRQAGCKFPRARIFRWDRPTPGEQLYELEGIDPAIPSNALARPRMYSWRLRDDRPKLMSIGLRKLEEANKLSVDGTLTIKGKSHDASKGLGFVDYPEQARASVCRAVYNFTAGWKIELELTRESARFGDMPPDEKVSLVDLRNELKALRHQVYSGGNFSSPTNNYGSSTAPSGE